MPSKKTQTAFRIEETLLFRLEKLKDQEGYKSLNSSLEIVLNKRLPKITKKEEQEYREIFKSRKK